MTVDRCRAVTAQLDFGERSAVSMGQMRFVIPRPERIVPGAAEWAYLASADGVPWECHVMIADEGVTIDRDTRESGYLYFPWKIADRGLVQLSSGSLMERQ